MERTTTYRSWYVKVIAAVRRVLTKLLSHDVLEDASIDVEVTIVPDEEAVSRILGMRGLKRLLIRVNRVNPDDFEDKKRRILNELEANNAKRKDLKYVKARGATKLTPTAEVRDIAEVAAENGFVEGEADGDGQPLKLSTREHPRKIVVEEAPGQSVLSRMVAYVRSVGQRGSQRT